MSLRTLRASLALAPLALVAACGSSTRPVPGEELRSSEARLAASADLAEARALSRSNVDFALALHAQLPRDENLFYSPHSISIALAMTYAGADGETAHEMRETLRFAREPAVLHQAFNTLDQLLASRGSGRPGADGEPFRLRVLDRLFAQAGFPVHQAYLDDMARYYGAGVQVLDFETDAEGARRAINAWVAEVTEERIEELLREGVVTSSTVLVLTNAVYFNAAWAEPFADELTTEADFHRLDGSVVRVPTMTSRAVATRAAQGPGWRAAELPYVGGEVAMVVVVPDDLATFEAALDGAALVAIVDALAPGDLAVRMPRFEMRSRFSLRETLQAMGMVRAFDDADFSRLSPADGLFVSDVVHEGFVKVDEEGTEAAAATAVIVDRVSIPFQVTLDRPFLFFVRDVETGAVVFVGRVVDPSAPRE